MTFNSITFFVFLVIVLCLYYVLTHRWQNRMLLVAGYVFYGWWDPRFLVLLALTTAVDYTVAQRIEDAGNRNSARRWLWVSIITNLSILGFFKYFNFFVDSTEAMLEWLGFRASLPTIRILLPVGISFYTFKEMAYTIDVYRGQLKACRNFVDFALFVSYFPRTGCRTHYAGYRANASDRRQTGCWLEELGRRCTADYLGPVQESRCSGYISSNCRLVFSKAFGHEGRGSADGLISFLDPNLL